MADKIISSDIFEISDFVNSVKQKYTGIDENTAVLGIYGYFGDIISRSIQNSVRMAAEYSNEAIPTKAKYEKNIITHALNLGIKELMATPSTMKVFVMFPLKDVEERLVNNRFRFDSKIPIYIDQYEFHTDYDIIIRKNMVNNESEAVYTAVYDITGENELSDITNPYLPPIGMINYSETEVMLVVTCTVRQVEKVVIEKSIIVDDPLENKTINFNFSDQLASFTVDVIENDGNRVHLIPVYEGLYDYDVARYCNYQYIDASTIRIKFDKDSYAPAFNCTVNININETHGAEGNFKYRDEVRVELDCEQSTINYDGMVIAVKPRGDCEAVDGFDKVSVAELKRRIPIEAISRGTMITTTDLAHFFNKIDNENCKIYPYKDKDNPMERLYYCYVVVKNENNIIPTNTLNIRLTRDELNVTEDGNLIMKPGQLIYLNPSKEYATIVNNETITEEDKEKYNKEGFLYMTPFLCILNKKPLYTSYFLDIINTTKDLEFTFVNQNTQIQYIASQVEWKRSFFTDRDIYKMDIEIVQNMNTDSGLLILNEENKVVGAKIKVCMVMYDARDIKPYRWIDAEFVDFDEETYSFSYQFKIKTDNIYDNANRIKVVNMKDIGTNREQYGYLTEKVKCKLLVFAQFPSNEYGRLDPDMNIDATIPGLDGYTLCNTYMISEKLEMFYNYTSIVNSHILVTENDYKDEIPDKEIDPSTGKPFMYYYVKRMPLVRDRYIHNESRLQTFIKEVELRRKYIQKALLELEDTFGIDFKFFNTYGPSTLFYLENGTKINRTNLSMKFKMKPYTLSDSYIKDNIIDDIKKYMEDINSIKDLHMPNLVTDITTKYKDQLVYFEFVDINGYGPGEQHIYMPESYHGDVVPEFLNINVTDKDDPDIDIVIM